MHILHYKYTYINKAQKRREDSLSLRWESSPARTRTPNTSRFPLC